MFIRFIIEFKNEYDEIETGIFQALGYLIDRSGILFEYDKKHLEDIRKWFNKNLDAPNKFSKAKRKNAAKVSLSWYKSTAIEHLAKMYELKEIIERYGMVVTVIKRKNAGYVVYEDEFQISTIPHKKDKSITK
jgi:hypothetical protein